MRWRRGGEGEAGGEEVVRRVHARDARARQQLVCAQLARLQWPRQSWGKDLDGLFDGAATANWSS